MNQLAWLELFGGNWLLLNDNSKYPEAGLTNMLRLPNWKRRVGRLLDLLGSAYR
jgi:hypothetical protein